MVGFEGRKLVQSVSNVFAYLPMSGDVKGVILVLVFLVKIDDIFDNLVHFRFF